ncbi:hypothetical protein EX30DRAFT_208101 [Ascodesmis nigricans]|uniref:RNA-dependent RNA polymerase n=1 Tax=Ascodesmis nigricans TaxID=341454 RepID=A0A4S2MR22_9PEZI|nr:hypothetical protein EX30DRAFT_208101 [Ascodesmis nigricans]
MATHSDSAGKPDIRRERFRKPQNEAVYGSTKSEEKGSYGSQYLPTVPSPPPTPPRLSDVRSPRRSSKNGVKYSALSFSQTGTPQPSRTNTPYSFASLTTKKPKNHSFKKVETTINLDSSSDESSQSPGGVRISERSRRQHRQENSAPHYPKIPVINLDSGSDVESYFSAIDSPSQRKRVGSAFESHLPTPPPDDSSPQKKTGGPQRRTNYACESFQKTQGAGHQSRRTGKRPTSIPEVPSATSSFDSHTAPSSFDTDYRSSRSTPLLTAQTSFASQSDVNSSFDPYRDYEDIPTEEDEPSLDPDPVSRKNNSFTTSQYKDESDDSTVQSRRCVVRNHRKLQERNVIEELDSDYIPDSDEERLLALQREFAVNPLEPLVPLTKQQSSLESSRSSDDEFGITEDLAEELSKLVIDKTDNVPEDPPPTKRPFSQFPYFIQHEITRLALDMGFSLKECEDELPELAHKHGSALLDAETRDAFVEAFDRLRIALSSHRDNLQHSSEHKKISKIGDSVWVALRSSRNWPDNVHLSGKLEYSNQDGFDFHLNPLSFSQGYRFSYRFGADRFLMLKLPSIKASTPKYELPRGIRDLGPDEIQRRLREWLRTTRINILNRTWRCFYVREHSESTTVKGVKQTATFMRAFFFAETGVGLGKCFALTKRYLRLEDAKTVLKNRLLCRDEMTREELILWHMPISKIMAKIAAEPNLEQRGGMFAKAWSRISLSLSTSRPTVTFTPDQIRYVEDTYSTPSIPALKPAIMDDGCCICSPQVMRRIRDILGLEETPAAVQGRLGGAKGMWFIDPDADWSSEALWIQIRPSQLKYPPHDSDSDPETADWARLTLFVIKPAKQPMAGHLNSQLIPILSERKVPTSTFEDLLNQDLEQELGELLKASRSRINLRCWLNGPGGMSRERDRDTSGEVRGHDSGKPFDDLETIAFLVDAGFEPSKCHYLVKLLAKVVETRCNSVTDRVHISVPQSTTAFCIADPTGTLEPGTISLNLGGFMDTKDQSKITMLEGEVLVTRNPAHLPSDIQKVRAVCPTHPGLRRLQNVAIFSTKGDYPLAGLLSGGDYDGDTVWVTWDSRLVKPFQNSSNNYLSFTEDSWFVKPSLAPSDLNPDPSDPEFFSQFFTQGFSASLIDNLTGYCTSILERYIYSMGRKIRLDSNAVYCAKLCGFFVDAPKQGLFPTPKTLNLLDRISRKARHAGELRYKTPTNRILDSKDRETCFILDYLVLHVARNKADEKKKEFEQNPILSNMDPDLLVHINKIVDMADELARNGNHGPRTVIKDLEKKLHDLKDRWCTEMNGVTSESFHSRLEGIYDTYRAMRPPSGKEHLMDPCVALWAVNPDEAGSPWCKLRAALAFKICTNSTTSFPWWMAAWELALFKAVEQRNKRNVQAPRVVAVDMYTALKPSKQARKMPEPSLYHSDAGTRSLS